MVSARKIWTAVAIAFIVWMLPTQSFGVETDPYAFRTFLGKIQLEYERQTNDHNGNKSKSHRFRQNYSLLFTGYALNRRLLVYDIGYGLTLSDYSSDYTSSNTTINNYYLKTTALPLSAIPLTLYASRRTSTMTTSDETTTTKNKYGFRWYLRFRTLPKTTLNAEREEDVESNGAKSTADTYRIDMEKAIGPTDNYFSYYLVNIHSPGSDSSLWAVNFNNGTKISRSTNVFLGATRSEGESTGNPVSTVTGVSLSLQSNPSRDFMQTHSYNFYNNDTGTDTQTGSIYNGDMQYHFTEHLDSKFNLQVNDVKSESPTSTSDSVTLATSMSVRYRMSRRFSFTQLVSYFNSKVNSSDPASNLTDTTRLRTLSSLNYSTPLSWAMLRASAGVGYTDEQSGTNRAGQAIEQDYRIALSKIDLNKYVGASTNVHFLTRSTISGNDIHRTRYQYQLNLYNKEWKQYFNSNADYIKSGEETYLTDLAYTNEAYGIQVKSSYFKNTTFRTSARHSKTYQELVGTGETTTLTFGVNHTREVFKGKLGLSYSLTSSKTRYNGGRSENLTNLYTLTYNRTFFGDMRWLFTAQRHTSDSLTTHNNVTTIKNSIHYPLRSWSLSGEHQYRVMDQTNYQHTQTILMLRASRSFVRFW